MPPSLRPFSFLYSFSLGPFFLFFLFESISSSIPFYSFPPSFPSTILFHCCQLPPLPLTPFLLTHTCSFTFPFSFFFYF
ncbi:unnamed protein product [Meloidogyne enterolobii]|uniref:Uncharacterized protein n=1 Tax=Meloidogyne enterolobii TaxID=390850 RepID=A0ACB0Z4Z2_MELEN